MATERKVRCIRDSGTAELERVWNAMVKDGWRLVASTSCAAGALDVFVWLFFERDISND
jgi:hypothetical protein